MTDIRVPTLGESVTEATIGKWFKKAGDTVAVDEPLVELETDKVTIEVPAPAAGVLSEIAAKDGETVAVGALLGQIKDGAGGAKAAAASGTSTGAPDKKTSTTAPIKAGEEEVKARFRNLHTIVKGGSLAETRAFIGKEREKWGKVIRTAGVPQQ